MNKTKVKAKGKGKVLSSKKKAIVKDEIVEDILKNDGVDVLKNDGVDVPKNDGVDVLKNDEVIVFEGVEKDVVEVEKNEVKEDVENSAASTERLKKRKRNNEDGSKVDSGSKRVDGMGMIFMCNSMTKKDCYAYNVLGLPASKKDLVAKIYKGMRLFLYDTDLKLLYGIYKASEPGGYNIEPKAFKSKFPSQVRFRAIEDCLPLPEEKFKAAIKENYFNRSKFDCKLKSDQVRKLCKLFHAATKNRGPERVRRAPVAEFHSTRDQNRDTSRSHRDAVQRERWQGREEPRRGHGDIHLDEHRAYRRELSPPRRLARPLSPPVHFRREVSPVQIRLPRPLSPPTYFRGEASASSRLLPVIPTNYPYERPLENVDFFRRERLANLQDRRLMDLELRRREEIVASLRDPEPYNIYRDSLATLHEPMYLPLASHASYQAPQASYPAPQAGYQPGYPRPAAAIYRL